MRPVAPSLCKRSQRHPSLSRIPFRFSCVVHKPSIGDVRADICRAAVESWSFPGRQMRGGNVARDTVPARQASLARARIHCRIKVNLNVNVFLGAV
ncbi:protein of unknown function (plasmid) [Cupriavidus neocaledonicus]|uniref:Uncharacterized protein n=1 Tax=Cupriavidus neocaledonicus TaxID=1040979 RepID=A0A375HR10_9BURK|nr:hypothetical protein CBM2605_B70006 [Cupriavidus neocaledonicus]SPD60648.1 protein of unknown function [Cupriavidus neocaledonicus]